MVVKFHIPALGAGFAVVSLGLTIPVTMRPETNSNDFGVFWN